MHMNAVRVDIESPTHRLEDPLSRITYPRAPKGWMVVQTDAGFVKEPKEGGKVISVGAFVFFDELGSIRYYDTVVLSWVSNVKETEFETIKFAMYEGVRIGIRKLSVCTDNFEILKAIQGGNPYPKDEFDKYREGNAVADLLAKWRMEMIRYPHTNPITNWRKVVQAAKHQYSGMPNFRIRYLKSKLFFSKVKIYICPLNYSEIFYFPLQLKKRKTLHTQDNLSIPSKPWTENLTLNPTLQVRDPITTIP
ncbi:uncharacterized protein LOC131314097 [Rhododendron vialii]|uniref:uncharacterized protein LOC131314097 n=1 Tax=Rhododendron vialii TaxID=182163 RepID=UPI00265FF85F|nr:uncharacterized protein LOC131314097 [Rhododendron vialii]